MTHPPTTGVDPIAMRQALGHFPTGVVVVTAAHEGRPVGMTLQSFVSLSLDPPLVLLSIARSSSSWPLIAEAGRFTVSVLAHDQHAVARQFARAGIDKFAGVEVVEAAGLGGVVIAGAVAWVDCAVRDVFDGGDHLIVVAAVLALEVDTSATGTPAPLVFHRSAFHALAPAPTSIVTPNTERQFA